jgi:RHS repeat-associated protein
MTAIRENGATSGIGVIGTLAYDNLGRRTSLTLGNGVATVYTYDPVSRLNDLKLDFAGTTDDLTSGFAYNPASQIASNARSNDAYAWTSHGSGTTSTTTNGRNQIASWVNTLSYDTKGNITVDGTYTYGYSSENLLTSLTNSATGALQPTIAFAYDPLMRLAVIDSSNAAFDVDFGYDGQEMVLEGLSSSRTRRYVYGPGVDEPLVGYLVTSTGTSRLWYQADERGSIARLSNDSGTPGGTGKFDEYGVGGTSRFRFTGQYWLGEANLLYYRARIYDPRLGRFLQPDPIGYGAGMNMYAYVKGDPVNFSDPTGLDGDVIEPDIIVTARKPIIVQIIDSGAMGAASAGLRSVGGTVGAAPGGGRAPGPASKPKAKPKPKPPTLSCGNIVDLVAGAILITGAKTGVGVFQKE